MRLIFRSGNINNVCVIKNNNGWNAMKGKCMYAYQLANTFDFN